MKRKAFNVSKYLLLAYCICSDSFIFQPNLLSSGKGNEFYRMPAVVYGKIDVFFQAHIEISITFERSYQVYCRISDKNEKFLFFT
jgi:hypothetical protein